MTYLPPSIGPTGLIIPSFADIDNFLIAQFLAIYGPAQYLGPDAQDRQDIDVRALQASDVMQALQAVALAWNPQTAVGVSLDLLGQLTQTVRKTATFSTVNLTLYGAAGTIVNSGVVQDVNSQLWNLPTQVLIGPNGIGTAFATAQQAGNVTANKNSVNQIITPTAGWSSVTNLDVATPGVPMEPDSAFRARIKISQSKPSLTLLAGTEAAILAVNGVTRAQVWENQYGWTASNGICSTNGTNTVQLLTGYTLDNSDINQQMVISGLTYVITAVSGSTVTLNAPAASTNTRAPYYVGGPKALGPPHSITSVVEGGTDTDVAQAIYDNKNPGVLTNGTTTISVTDALNGGIGLNISFYRLQPVSVFIAITVQRLAGYTSATSAAIQQHIVDYLNSLGIGQPVIQSEIYGAALLARPDPDNPLFSIISVQMGTQSAFTAGTTTQGSPNITVQSGTGIAVGQAVVCPQAFPAGTTIASGSGTAWVASQSATAGVSGAAMTFYNLNPSSVTSLPFQFNTAASATLDTVAVTAL